MSAIFLNKRHPQPHNLLPHLPHLSIHPVDEAVDSRAHSYLGERVSHTPAAAAAAPPAGAGAGGTGAAAGASGAGASDGSNAGMSALRQVREEKEKAI